MNMLTVAIGMAALGFGVYTVHLRLTNPNKLMNSTHLQ